jgi:catechol 2,3-dioxygenase-like lactoylglutathione lyase family enzyme
MTSRIAVLAIDTPDPEPLAAFWCAVLGWQVVEREEHGWTIAGEGQAIDLLRVPDGKTVKNRLHLDLRADGSSTEAELARLEQLGATRVDVGQPADATWTVLADPQGNEFCLLSRTVQQVATTPG